MIDYDYRAGVLVLNYDFYDLMIDYDCFKPRRGEIIVVKKISATHNGEQPSVLPAGQHTWG